MNIMNLSPRPTRSTLRNRRIVKDLRAGLNGSYVGQDGLKTNARRAALQNQDTYRREYVLKAVAITVLALAMLLYLTA